MFFKGKRSAYRIRLHDAEDIVLSFKYEGRSYDCCIFDYSRFGLGIRIEDGDQLPKVNSAIDEITIKAFGETRKLGQGQICYEFKNENHLFFGITLLDEFVDLELLTKEHKVYLQEDEIKSIQLYFQYSQKATTEIKAFSSEFSYGLGVYKKVLDELDRKFRREPEEVRESLFKTLLRGVGRDLKKYLNTSLDQLNQIVKNYTRIEHEQNGFFLRRVVWPYIAESLFLHRTNTKPRGYAGDFKMMEMCYTNDYEGNSSFGKILHKHPLETEAAQAVRVRRELLNQELVNFIKQTKKRPVQIISIACGPAYEMRDFFSDSEFKHDVELYLFDQDEMALSSAEQAFASIATDKPFQVKYLRDSVRNLIKTSEPDIKYGKFDFVYSMGLYDYLTQPVAKAILNKLYSMLDSGGRLIIGNYHYQNPTKVYMEYLMDWALIYRDETSFADLTAELPGKFSFEIKFEDTRSQMFLHVDKE